MLIRVGCEIEVVFPEPTALMLMLSLHPLRGPTIRQHENLQVEPQVPVSQFFDMNGNRCGRAVVSSGHVTFRNSAIVEDCGLPDLQAWSTPQTSIYQALILSSIDRYMAYEDDLAERLEQSRERDELLQQFPYPVMLELAYTELDFAIRWCWQRFGPMDGDCTQKNYTHHFSEYRICFDETPHRHAGEWTTHWFVKTGYDFGFCEWYFSNEADRDLFLTNLLTLITPSDKEYQATKRIKLGHVQLAAPFDEIAAWISEKWQATVLNVIYDGPNDFHAPRLQVILEDHNDEQVFRDGYNFDRTKQQAIASEFLQQVNRKLDHGYEVGGLFVVFCAFAPLAREEADGRISDQEIDALKRRIGNADLWEISRYFGHVTFMFYNDVQVKEYTAMGKKAEYAGMYFELLKPYDEFGYLSKGDFAVKFDSKQNFDDNYKSNWFRYWDQHSGQKDT